MRLVVPDADEAASWYASAFGARELGRIPLPGDRVMTVELAFGESVVHVGSEFPEMGIVSPMTIGDTASVLQINTDDASALWARATAAGGFAGRAGQAGRTHILDAGHGVGPEQFEACFEKQLFSKRITHLHRWPAPGTPSRARNPRSASCGSRSGQCRRSGRT